MDSLIEGFLFGIGFLASIAASVYIVYRYVNREPT
jgi:hypothetical protein